VGFCKVGLIADLKKKEKKSIINANKNDLKLNIKTLKQILSLDKQLI